MIEQQVEQPQRIQREAITKPVSEAPKQPSRLLRVVRWLLDGNAGMDKVAARYQKSGMMTAFPGQGSGRDRDNKPTDKQVQPR